MADNALALVAAFYKPAFVVLFGYDAFQFRCVSVLHFGLQLHRHHHALRHVLCDISRVGGVDPFPHHE